MDPKHYGYPVDGLIMEYDDVSYGKSLGATGHHENRSKAKNSRNRFPTSAASSFRTLPAARFLGWLYGSSRLRLIFLKFAHEMTPSPRTSNGKWQDELFETRFL